MRQVFKFIVPFASEALAQMSEMPADPNWPVVLTGVDPRSGQPAIWLEAVAGQCEPHTGRRFAAFGTGHDIPLGWAHRGSLIDGSFVWHIYEQVQK